MLPSFAGGIKKRNVSDKPKRYRSFSEGRSKWAKANAAEFLRKKILKHFRGEEWSDDLKRQAHEYIRTERRETAAPFVPLPSWWTDVYRMAPDTRWFFAQWVTGAWEIFSSAVDRVNIRNSPRRKQLLKESAKRTKERRKQDPERHARHKKVVQASNRRHWERCKTDPELDRRRRESAAKSFQKHKDKIMAKRAERKARMTEEEKADRRAKNAAWHRNRRQTDPQYQMGNRLRSRIWHAIQNGTEGKGQKADLTEELIGCTVAECVTHLESKFLPGMTWENTNKWHIDHIIPCASFDLTDEEQQRKCFHHTNLQPLWAEENIRKKDKIPEDISTSHEQPVCA